MKISAASALDAEGRVTRREIATSLPAAKFVCRRGRIAIIDWVPIFVKPSIE